MRENCRSVMVRNRTSPAAGTFSPIRPTCTSAFSIEAQWREIDRELHHREAVVEQILAKARIGLARCGVSTGRSNMAMTHMLRHPQGNCGNRLGLRHQPRPRRRARSGRDRHARGQSQRRSSPVSARRARRRSASIASSSGDFRPLDHDGFVEQRQQRGAGRAMVEGRRGLALERQRGLTRQSTNGPIGLKQVVGEAERIAAVLVKDAERRDEARWRRRRAPPPRARPRSRS